MKKLLLLIIIAFLVTGCSIVKINDSSVDKLVSEMINNNIKLSNRVGIGYNYYLPNNVTVLEVNEDNEVLYSNGDKYYLYVDLISYQKQVKSEYKVDSSLYLSKIITNGKKEGYLQIDKIGRQYYIEMMYNYAKIETYVYEYQLEDTMINLSYILSSVKYNDEIVDSLIANKLVTDKGKEFKIFKPNAVGNTYIDNSSADVTDTSNAIDDPDVININLNE